VQSNGKVSVATGIGTRPGTFSRPGPDRADQLGVASPMSTSSRRYRSVLLGAGTFASRGRRGRRNASTKPPRCAQKALKLASDLFECARKTSCSRTAKSRSSEFPKKIPVSLADLARLANPMRGAVQPAPNPGSSRRNISAADECDGQWRPRHDLEMEANLRSEILKYVVVHDCGTVINPMIWRADQGGVAQGIASLLTKNWPSRPGPAAGTLRCRDYLCLTALEVPRVELGTP